MATKSNRELVCHVNLYMKDAWFERLSQLARERSVEEQKNISLLDLIRESLNEKYHLDD